MELIKWQNVIIDWVNCLNISKPVQSVNDLKNEDFFRKLLNFLTQNQCENAAKIEENTSLTEFLKKHYPAYRLDIEPALIQDDLEISYICSLLLHFCCIIDARQELIVPLCKDLSISSQIILKSFLEELQDAKEITRDLLSDVINNITKLPSTPTKSFKSSPLDSPKTPANTSLLEFLKTPLKKQHIFDSHKKEIKALQVLLDLERFEKADLQEELNIQYDRNKKLDRTIIDKQFEIKRLRCELLAIESQTPPSATKTEGRLENKRLGEEIASLEKYIEILHKEQEDLQNERDKAREKVRKIEEQCNEWQDRALHAERHCTKLTEENDHQKFELIELREKCEELTSILKELNTKNICDESYDTDTSHSDFTHNRSGSIDYDNLAHTVVDVQLIDAQEENKNLRKQLGELEVNTTELASHMNQLQLEITNIMKENTNLNKKFNDVDKECKKCNQLLQQTKSENEELIKKLSQSENDLTSCQFELKSTQHKNDNLNAILDQKLTEISVLTTERATMNSENQTMKDCLYKLNKNLENCLIKFKQHLNEYVEYDSSDFDHITNFKNLLIILEKRNVKYAENISEFQKKILKLNENELLAEKEINQMKNSLDDAKVKMKCHEAEIVKLNKIVDSLRAIIVKKTNEISDLSKIKDDLNMDKTNLTINLETMESKLVEEKKQKELIENDFEKMKIDVKKKECSIKVLEEQKIDLEKHVGSLNKEIESEKKHKAELEKQCFKLQSIFEDVEKQMKFLEKDKLDLSLQLKELQEEIMSTKQAQSDLQANNAELQKIINEKDNYTGKLDSAIKKLEKQLEDASNFNLLLKNEVDVMSQSVKKTSTYISDLESEKHKIKKKIVDLEAELSEQIKMNVKFKEEFQELEKSLIEKQVCVNNLEIEKDKIEKQLEIVIKNLTSEKAEATNKNQKLQHELAGVNQNFNMIDIEISSIVNMLKTDDDLEQIFDTNTITILLQKITNIKNKICTLIFDKRQLDNENSSLQQQVSDFETLKEEFSNKITLTLSENEKHTINIDIYRKKLNDAENALSQTQMSVEKLIEKHNSEKDDYENSIKQLQEENNNLQDQLKQMNKVGSEVNIELHSIRDELKKNVKHFKDKREKLKKENKQLAEDKNALTKKLDEVTEDCLKLKSSIEDDMMKHEKKLHQMENLQNNLEQTILTSNKKTIQKLENKIKTKDESISELTLKIIENGHTIEHLEKEKNKMISELLHIKTELKDTIILYKHSIEAERNLKKDYEMLQTKVSKLHDDKKSLKLQLKESTENYNELMNSYEVNIQEHNQNLVKIDKEKITLSNSVGKLIEELKIQTNEKDDFISDLNEKMSESIQKIKILHDERSTYCSELNHIKKSVNLLEEQKHLNEKTIDDLKVETKEKDSLIVNLNSKVDEYNQIIKNLNCDKTKSISELENMKISLQDLENKKLSNEKTIDDLSATIKEKDNLITDLNVKIVDSVQIIEQLYTEKNKLISELSHVKKSVNDLENNKASDKKLNEELKDQINKNNIIITDLKEQRQELTKKVDNLLNEKNKLLSELSALKLTATDLKEKQKILTNQLQDNNKEASLIIEHLKVKLQKAIGEITSKRNILMELCNEYYQKFNALYTVLFENSKNSAEEQLPVLYKDKDQINKKYNLIFKEILLLKISHNEISNYSSLKSDYSASKIENNTLREKISEIENKLSLIHLENTKYQKDISEKELDLKNMKERYNEEVNLLKTTSNNWQKIINNNDIEYKKLKELYAKELENLEKIVSGLQQENKDNNRTIIEYRDKYEELNKIYNKATESLTTLELELKNTKQNYEEEIKVMTASCNNWQKIISNNDIERKQLKDKYETQFLNLKKTILDLQQQIKANNNKITQKEYEELTKKYELANEKIFSLGPETLALKEKIIEYKKIIENLEKDNLNLTKKCNELSEEDVIKLRNAYSETMSENSRFQLDCAVLKKTIEDRNNQLGNLTLIKEAYEKLLEENNKANMELDTLRYKRNRDKEEFRRVLDEAKTHSDSQIQEVKNEYEEKLKKMKDKIVKLYREEVEKEKKKVSNNKQDQVKAEETIASLKSQLWTTGSKYIDVKRENEKLREQLSKSSEHQIGSLEIAREISSSRESICSLRERRPKFETEERRISTLPRDMRPTSAVSQTQFEIIEESLTISRRRRSITATVPSDHGLKMEDEEGEIFDNTYLADLKAGRCILSDRDSISSSSSRLSELQFRNSLCPPHLKSSYPAETQFSSPGQFKEDEIKMGTVDLDDSMSSSLLPGEKPRTKKDWGQTLYKKPGPPTPSKNGGRLSLQGNEVQPREVLRDQNENRPSGRTTSTPSRIRSLFTRSSSKADTENVPSTPKGPSKKLRIFRR